MLLAQANVPADIARQALRVTLFTETWTLTVAAAVVMVAQFALQQQPWRRREQGRRRELSIAEASLRCTCQVGVQSPETGRREVVVGPKTTNPRSTPDQRLPTTRRRLHCSNSPIR